MDKDGVQCSDNRVQKEDGYVYDLVIVNFTERFIIQSMMAEEYNFKKPYYLGSFTNAFMSITLTMLLQY